MAVAARGRRSEGEKLQLALEARDAALALAQKVGKWERVCGHPVLWFRSQDYEIAYRAALQALPKLVSEIYSRNLTSKIGSVLPYVIDIWENEGGKILVLEWDDTGVCGWTTFKVGKVRQFLAWAEEHQN
jgi:hypothetical protein